MSFLDDPVAELRFGDFCETELFYDAYLRSDAATLRERTVTGAFVKKEFQTDTLTSYIPVNEIVPALKAQQGHDFLLAHGSHFDTAACLSDDCEIASRLGRDGGEASGRLIFAPVTQLKREEKETLTTTNWGRMLLGDQVVEIRRAFAVAAEDVAELDARGELRRSSLDDEAKLQLATWWSAYTCRRGPLVDAVNLAKLAQIADAHGEGDRGRALEDVLKTVAAAAWRLQGHAMERAGEEYDDHRGDLPKVDWPSLVDTLRGDVEVLADAVDTARAVTG